MIFLKGDVEVVCHFPFLFERVCVHVMYVYVYSTYTYMYHWQFSTLVISLYIDHHYERNKHTTTNAGIAKRQSN